MAALPKTPATLAQLLGAASAVLPRPAALLAAADWCWETAGGASLYGQNPGNLTCGAVPRGTVQCGNNPLVTSGLSFAIFPSLAAGAAAYVAFLKGRGQLPALQSGDLPTFSAALAKIGYAGSDTTVTSYESGMNAWLPKLKAVVLPPAGSSSTLNQVAVIGAAAIGAAFFGRWAAEGFRR